jgi:hypothetical protein
MGGEDGDRHGGELLAELVTEAKEAGAVVTLQAGVRPQPAHVPGVGHLPATQVGVEVLDPLGVAQGRIEAVHLLESLVRVT